MDTLYRITPEERVEGKPTPGMAREEAIQTDGMWAGFVTTEAGMVSGWHHHGEYESAIYVITGGIRMEFGPGGSERFDAGPETSSTSRSTRSIGRATRPRSLDDRGGPRGPWRARLQRRRPGVTPWARRRPPVYSAP